MNPMITTHHSPKLLWASQLFDDGVLASWQFSSPAGQWFPVAGPLANAGCLPRGAMGAGRAER